MQYSYNPFQKTQVSDLKVYDGGDVPCTPFNIQKALEQIYQYTAELRYFQAKPLQVKFF